MDFDISSPSLDQGISTPSGLRNSQNTLKFEVNNYNPFEVEPKKPGLLARIFSAIGKFAPLAAVAAPFTGGLSLIGAVAAQGIGNMGDKAIVKNQQIEAQKQRNATPTFMSYPGMMSQVSVESQPALALISDSRQTAENRAVQGL